MIPKSYLNYKIQKLQHPEFQSEFETKAVYVITKLKCATDFFLILLKKETADIAKVEIASKSNKKVFKITNLNAINHSLSLAANIPTYDGAITLDNAGKAVATDESQISAEDKNAIEEAISDLPSIDIPVFIFSSNKLLLPTGGNFLLHMMLRSKMPQMRVLSPQVKFDDNTTKGIINVNHGLIGKYTIATNCGSLSLLDYLFKKENQLLPLTVPQDNATLASNFCGNLTWGDIMPVPHTYNRIIGGVECMTLILRTVIDAFQNLFLYIRDAFGNVKIICMIDTVGDTEHMSSVILKKEIKTSFIIDTNAFIYEPEIVERITENVDIYLPQRVINEIDGLKRRKETEQSAKRALKILNDNSTRIKYVGSKPNLLPSDFSDKDPDNRILSSVMYLLSAKVPVTLITCDNGMLLKAKSLNLTVISLKDFHNSAFYKKNKNGQQK